MRMVVPVALTAILLAGCSASVSIGDESPNGSTSPSGSATVEPEPSSTAIAPIDDAPTDTPSGSAAPTGAVAAADWQIVSQDLGQDGAQLVFDAAADGSTAVASVLSEVSADDYDAGIVYSQDAGATWAWGGLVADAGQTFPEGILLVADGAVIVGTNQVNKGGGLESRAFVAVAAAPGFEPKEVDLPEQFAGNGVHLQDIVAVDGEWVIAGYTQGKPDDKGRTRQTAVLWRSSDEGANWTKQVLKVPGGQDTVIKQLVIAPDGTWNAVGQVSSGDLISQYDPMWMTSTDGGKTFTLQGTDVLTGDFDQGANRIAINDDGSVAILGWDEVTDEEHSTVSAMWLAVPGHDLARLGDSGVPVAGGTPQGQFLDGILWDEDTLVAWGSADGVYPMPDVQFWALSGGQLEPSATLPGNGTALAVSRILTGGDTVLAFGFTGEDIDQADVGIWRGSLTK